MSSLRPRSIFLQIEERIQDSILLGIYPTNSRIPSVRDMAELMEVNPNTVAKAYDRLLSKGVVYTQRGVGYYVAPEAYGVIYAEKREVFFRNSLPHIFRQMRLLHIDINQLQDPWKEYLSSTPIVSPTSYPIEEGPK